MNKKIITIAEIVFALVFVVLLAVFMATINSKGNQANSQLVDTMDMTGGVSLEKYINMGADDTVKGSDVINVCNNYRVIGGDIKLMIHIKTSANASTGAKNANGTLYGYYTRTDKEGTPGSKVTLNPGVDIGTYTTLPSSDENYINPSGDFKVSCPENSNGLHDYIYFEQVIK